MNYTIYDYLGLFFFYAFLGWLLETSVAAIRKKHMVNRGFLNGPLCAIGCTVTHAEGSRRFMAESICKNASFTAARSCNPSRTPPTSVLCCIT